MNIDKILSKEEIPEINTLSPLTLAFIGDGVYEMFIRTKILSLGNQPANQLHKTAVKFVKASQQARAAHEIFENLSDEEREIYKRGRNTNIHTVPKNADMSDYRHATALEALVGYLYIKGESVRLEEVLDTAFTILNRE